MTELPDHCVMALALCSDGETTTVVQWHEGEWSPADVPPAMVEQISTMLSMFTDSGE